MWILVNILIAIAALMTALLGALVVLPFRVRAVGELTEDSLGGEATLGWCFGLVGILASSKRGVFLALFGRPVLRLRLDDDEEVSKKEKPRTKRSRKKSKRSKRTFRENLVWLRDSTSTLRRLTARLLRTFQVRLRLVGTLGCADPADTAVFVAALRVLDQVTHTAQIDVRPDYLNDRLDLAGEVSGRVWLLAILWVAFTSLFELRIWILLRSLT